MKDNTPPPFGHLPQGGGKPVIFIWIILKKREFFPPWGE